MAVAGLALPVQRIHGPGDHSGGGVRPDVDPVPEERVRAPLPSREGRGEGVFRGCDHVQAFGEF